MESKEGQQAFADIGQSYEKSIQDELYDKWLHDTSAERMSEYSRHKEKEVNSIRRVKAHDGKEYLVYSYIHHRLDRALNVTHRYRPENGRYPIPEASYYIQRTDFGKEERKFKEIISMSDGFSIPYSPKKVDEIRNIGTPINGSVQYMVQMDNGLKISVKTYKDFRDGDFHELAHFGRIPNDLERRLWNEKEGGSEADKQRYEEYKITQIDGRDILPRMPTMQEVKEMIAKAKAEGKAEALEAKANTTTTTTTATTNKQSKPSKKK